MRPKISTCVTAMTLFTALASPLQLAAQAPEKNNQPPKYYVFNLGAALALGAATCVPQWRAQPSAVKG